MTRPPLSDAGTGEYHSIDIQLNISYQVRAHGDGLHLFLDPRAFLDRHWADQARKDLVAGDIDYMPPLAVWVDAHQMFSDGRLGVVSGGYLLSCANGPLGEIALINCIQVHPGYEGKGACFRLAMLLIAMSLWDLVSRRIVDPDAPDYLEQASRRILIAPDTLRNCGERLLEGTEAAKNDYPGMLRGRSGKADYILEQLEALGHGVADLRSLRARTLEAAITTVHRLAIGDLQHWCIDRGLMFPQRFEVLREHKSPEGVALLRNFADFVAQQAARLDTHRTNAA